MEATGVYWKPVWHILDDGEFELVLANAAHVKNVPGDLLARHAEPDLARVAAARWPGEFTIPRPVPVAACGRI